MSEQTAHLVQALRRRVRSTIRRISLADLAFGLVLTLGILAALWLLSVAVEAGLWLGTEPRTVLFWGIVLVAAGLLLYFLLVPLLRLAGLLRGPSEDEVARRIGARYPEVSDRLVNLLHLSEGRSSEAPSAMLDGAVRMLGECVEPVPFEQVEDFHRARRVGRLASLPLVGLLLFLLAAPTTFLDASRRLLSPGASFERPAPFQLQIEPGDTEVIKGDPVEVAVRAVPRTSGGALPERLALLVGRPGEEQAEAVTMTPDSSGVFRHQIAGVRQPLRYRAEADDVTSPWHTVTVVERPLVRGLQVSLDFPNYTRLPSQRLEPGVGDVTALPGTRVQVEVGVGGPDSASGAGQAVQEAFLRFDDGRLDTLTLNGGTATGSFALREKGHYEILLRSARGAENDDPITYALGLLTDAPPSVVLLAPEADATLDETLGANLRMRLADDFGFSKLRLLYRVAERRYGEPMEDFEPLDLSLEKPTQLDQEVLYNWLLTEATDLDPIPGDVIEYYVEVWDNDAVAGYKAAKSTTQRLSMPSLAEQYQQLEEGQDGAEETLDELLRQTESVSEEFQELRDEIRTKQEADWQDQRQLERLQEQQQQMEEQVHSLQQQVESMTSQMEEGGLVSEETLEMYRDLQKVVEEISSPELQEAMEQLREAMENLDLQQMQESIENFEFSEEQYKERLERTLELFKNLRVQQGLEEAARRAEELAKQEEKLAEETSELLGEEDEEGEEEREKGGEGEREEEENGENGKEEEGTEEGEGENEDGEQRDGEEQEGEQEGEQQDGEQQDGEQQGGEQQEGQESDEQQEGQENQEGEQNQENQQGDQQQGDQEQQSGEQQENNEQPTTNDEQKRESLARQQEMSADEMRQLQEQIEEVREQMEELQQSPSQEMERLQEQLDNQQIPQEMQKNAQQMKQNQLQEAKQGQQQMQQQLQQLQQQLQQMQSGMQGQQMQVNMAGLRRALDDVLRLSQQQEDVRQSVRGLASDSPQLREQARQQIELSENLSTVSDSLQSLARDIPQMSRAVQEEAGEALREMGAATEAMSERAASQASGHQKGSMTHLNELALLLSDLMDQMMNNAQGGSGQQSMQQMMQQMQDMAGQQQQLNEQIQQMLNDMQGNRLSNDAQGRLRQMAEQQEAIRRQLRSIARNPEARGKMLGDLNKIAEQMQESIEELQRGQADRRTIERQQQILTRLLDAQRSLQERGREKRRESETGRDFDRESPDALTPTEQADKLRRDLIRALESGYAPDYQELIKRYFDLLQQQETE